MISLLSLPSNCDALQHLHLRYHVREQRVLGTDPSLNFLDGFSVAGAVDLVHQRGDLLHLLADLSHVVHHPKNGSNQIGNSQ